MNCKGGSIMESGNSLSDKKIFECTDIKLTLGRTNLTIAVPYRSDERQNK